MATRIATVLDLAALAAGVAAAAGVFLAPDPLTKERLAWLGLLLAGELGAFSMLVSIVKSSRRCRRGPRGRA